MKLTKKTEHFDNILKELKLQLNEKNIQIEAFKNKEKAFLIEYTASDECKNYCDILEMKDKEIKSLTLQLSKFGIYVIKVQQYYL